MPTLQSLKTNLQQKLEGATKIAVLGVGSELRADDNAGLLVAQRLKERMSVETQNFASLASLQVFLGGTAPENLTGEIKRFNPTHLVIIDAADLDAAPGTITLLDPDRIGGTTFCTHSLPLKIMIDYLRDSFECHVIVIGLQPKSLAVGAPVSAEVLDAVESLAALLVETVPLGGQSRTPNGRGPLRE